MPPGPLAAQQAGPHSHLYVKNGQHFSKKIAAMAWHACGEEFRCYLESGGKGAHKRLVIRPLRDSARTSARGAQLVSPCCPQTRLAGLPMSSSSLLPNTPRGCSQAAFPGHSSYLPCTPSAIVSSVASIVSGDYFINVHLMCLHLLSPPARKL